MKKFFVAVFSLVTLVSVRAIAEETLIIQDSDWPPYSFAGKGNHPGIVKDVLGFCIPKAGFKAEFKFHPIQRMHEYITEGKLDITTFSYTKEREAIVAFSKVPFFSASYRPIVKADSKIVIKSLADFDALKVGHLNGLKYKDDYLKYIEKRKAENKLDVSTSNTSILEKLVLGRIDIFVDTKESIFWLAKEEKMRDKIKALDYDVKTSDYMMAVSLASPRIKDRAKFIADVDTCITGLKDGKTKFADGQTYSQKMKMYGME